MIFIKKAPGLEWNRQVFTNCEGGDVTRFEMIKLANLLLLICVIISVMTGLALFFDYEGPGAALAGRVHAFNGLIFIVLVGLHIYFHWPMVRKQFLERKVTPK
jgi:cytochrome b subunit of formate dehydrogenase